MKKVLFFLFILFVTELSAQSDKNYMIRTKLGYSNNYKDMMDESDGFTPGTVSGVINRDFKFDFDMGRKLKSNFYYGLGFSYEAIKQEYNPENKIPDPNNNSGYSNNLTSYTNYVSRFRSYSPVIFIQYYYNITDRISINVDFYSRYNFTLTTSEANSEAYQSIDTLSLIVTRNYKESKKQFICAGFSPSFRINIIKNLGMEFVFGSIEYKQKLKDSRAPGNIKYSNEFKIGFKPENWLIGFYIKI